MLMICSSRARHRSADPVISCFFGRIAPSDASQNHDLQDEQIQKTICKLLRPQMPKSCNLNTEAAPKSDSSSKTYELFQTIQLAASCSSRFFSSPTAASALARNAAA